MVHEASNMQRRLKNEPIIPLPKSAEPGKALPNGQVKEQQKTAAAILADKIAASSNSQQILQSALSKFAAEEAKNSSETRSDKRQKTDQPLQVPSVANAAAFVPMPLVVATTAQQQPQPQAMLVQQAPMQSQAPAPQYNIYQPPPQQFVQQPGGVMMGMAYNMSTMTPPPPPPPQMMNLGRPSPSAPQQQMAVMPQTQPQPMLQQQMPMSLAPQMQFALQQPGVPPFRPMQQPPPPGMQYFHPQSH
jgi:regulator of Ty1 transposition protein 103